MKEEVTDYVFKPLFEKPIKEGVSGYKFHEFTDSELFDMPEQKKMLRIERSKAQESGFLIAPVVREHRGINKQEQEERERTIEEEINKRLKKVRDEAFKQGHQEGIEAGRKEIFEQMRLDCEQKIERFSEMINQVIATQSQLVEQEKIAIYRTIRSLTKWVILRELKDDGEYIERLLTKLIEEIQVKSNLLIQVDPKSFETMPEVLEHVERVLGQLDQVRLEQDFEIAGPGIIIDSDNGIINGTLQEQFKSIDRLFSKVGIESEDGEHEGLFQRLSINEEVTEESEKIDQDDQNNEVKVAEEAMDDSETIEESSKEEESSEEKPSEDDSE